MTRDAVERLAAAARNLEETAFTVLHASAVLDRSDADFDPAGTVTAMDATIEELRALRAMLLASETEKQRS